MQRPTPPRATLIALGGAAALVAVVMAVAMAGGPTTPRRCAEPEKPDRGYRMLFDGTRRSAARWRHSGPGGFRLSRTCALASFGGLGLVWHRRPARRPFTLRLDWRVAGDDNSGVFVGFPAPGGDPSGPIATGYEIQIDATDAPERTTGAIYGFQGPDVPRRDRALRPPGAWNTFRITVDPPRIVVRLNGVVINRFRSGDPGRLKGGHVGLQNHAEGDRVWFRNVQITSRGRR